MDYIINDTNILIDIYDIDLIEEFFCLNFSFHTTDFVIDELVDTNQRDAYGLRIKSKQLQVKTHTAKEVIEIVSFKGEIGSNVSITDCSVLLFAHKTSYTLITGDGKLRNTAK
ncbi:hypothetical protein EYV94_12035 [Puteibacter caeruleilacunae]|nr:hypothetical protein EYV94_12035 [Puteibacter caeruleilacunae]